MSIEIQTDIWKYSKHQGSALLLLLAIGDQARDETRTAWPSTSYLAKKTRLSMRSIHRLVSDLEESGEVEVERNRGRNRVNLYYIRPYAKDENVPDSHILFEPIDTSVEIDAIGKCVTGDVENVTPVTLNVTPVASKCDIPPTSNHKETLEETLKETLLEDDDRAYPEYVSILRSIELFDGNFEDLENWRLRKKISEEQAEITALALKGRPDICNDQGRDLYATFQGWCRKDAIKNPTRAVQFENSPSKFELLKAQQEERELSGVSNGDIDGDTREIYGASI